jgi:hypothetical protein
MTSPGSHGASLLVEAEHPRRALEPDLFQMRQHGVDAGRPRVGGPVDGLADAYCADMPATCQGLLVHDAVLRLGRRSPHLVFRLS